MAKEFDLKKMSNLEALKYLNETGVSIYYDSAVIIEEGSGEIIAIDLGEQPAIAEVSLNEDGQLHFAPYEEDAGVRPH